MHHLHALQGVLIILLFSEHAIRMPGLVLDTYLDQQHMQMPDLMFCCIFVAAKAHERDKAWIQMCSDCCKPTSSSNQQKSHCCLLNSIYCLMFCRRALTNIAQGQAGGIRGCRGVGGRVGKGVGRGHCRHLQATQGEVTKVWQARRQSVVQGEPARVVMLHFLYIPASPSIDHLRRPCRNTSLPSAEHA